MLKHIIIILIISSFCIGQISLTESQANNLTKKIADLEKKVKEQDNTIRDLSDWGGSIENTDSNTDERIKSMENLIASYDNNISRLQTEINERASRRDALKKEKETHKEYLNNLVAMKKEMEKKVSELKSSFGDLSDYTDQVANKLDDEPRSTLENE